MKRFLLTIILTFGSSLPSLAHHGPFSMESGSSIHELHLGVIETINSVLKQTYSKFEIILIHDDPYNPDYKDLIKFKKRDKRIKLIKNSKNIGAGFSRNKGIKKAKGFYIAFCDGDDTWRKDGYTWANKYFV